LKQLPFVAERLHSPQSLPAPENPLAAKHLRTIPRVSHDSNINSACEPCGKPKARACAPFFVAATAGFSMAAIGSARLRRKGWGATSSRKNFRKIAAKI
jgi:hypothetical protein